MNLLLVAGRRVALDAHVVVPGHGIDAAVGPAHRLRSTSVKAATALGRVTAASASVAPAVASSSVATTSITLLRRRRPVAATVALLGRRGPVAAASVALGRAVALRRAVLLLRCAVLLAVALRRASGRRAVALRGASGRRAAGRRLPGISAIAALGRVAAWWRGHSVKRCVRGARAAGARARSGLRERRGACACG